MRETVSRDQSVSAVDSTLESEQKAPSRCQGRAVSLSERDWRHNGRSFRADAEGIGRTGETSLRLTLPHFEGVALPDDLGLFYRAFVWVVTSGSLEARLITFDEYNSTASVINQVEYDMILSGLMETD